MKILDWKSQIETWNQMIRQGFGAKVAEQLNRIPREGLSQDAMAKIANLAWRINHPKIGLRILFPELRREQNLSAKSSPELFTEYAACLLEVGAGLF